MSSYLAPAAPCPFCALAVERGRRERLLALVVISRCTCNPPGTIDATAHAAACPASAEVGADEKWEPPEPEPTKWMTPEEFPAMQRAGREAERAARGSEGSAAPTNASSLATKAKSIRSPWSAAEEEKK